MIDAITQSWTPEALAAAIGVLTAAMSVAAVRMAQTYAAVVNILEAVHRAGIPVRGARGAAKGSGIGGGGAISRISDANGLLNVPDEAQRTDLTVSTTPAWTGSVDCGPECVVAVLQFEHHQETIAQLLRLRYFGRIDMRLTNADDLAGMLRQNGVAAHPQYVVWDKAEIEMPRALQMGWPCLVLLSYIGGSTPHWYVVKGHPGNTWVLMDPWLGADVTTTSDVLGARYLGQYVHVDRAPAVIQ